MLEFANCQFSQGAFSLSVNWSLEPGNRVAVIGPSGAGKSTLLGGLAGFVPVSSGHIRWQGLPLPDVPGDRPVSMLFQDHNLFPHLSVAQNVGLGLRATLGPTIAEQDAIAKALVRVGLGDMGARRPADLSGGQQSRVALARVMVMARPVILLDEPFAALGPAQRTEMLEIVKDVAAVIGAILIMVTHDPGEARKLGGLVSFVENGCAAVPVEAGSFFANPPEGLLRYTGQA